MHATGSEGGNKKASMGQLPFFFFCVSNDNVHRQGASMASIGRRCKQARDGRTLRAVARRGGGEGREGHPAMDFFPVFYSPEKRCTRCKEDDGSHRTATRAKIPRVCGDRLNFGPVDRCLVVAKMKGIIHKTTSLPVSPS